MRARFTIALLALAGVIGTPGIVPAQSSLGGSQTLAPPARVAQATRPATPARPPAGRTAPTPRQRPSTQRPQAQRPATPPTAAQRQTAAQRRAAAQAAVAAAAAAAAASAAAAAAAPEPEAVPEPQQTIGTVTGLPMPRFAALRSNDVNLRVGPDRRFPVEWRYQRADLPVQIIREHEQWRRIRDPEGAEGWLAASNLQPGRRTFIVRGEAGAEVHLRRRAEDGAAPVARLRPGVIGRLRSCDGSSAWCEVQVQDRRGYIRRSEIFGVMPDEEIK